MSQMSQSLTSLIKANQLILSPQGVHWSLILFYSLSGSLTLSFPSPATNFLGRPWQHVSLGQRGHRALCMIKWWLMFYWWKYNGKVYSYCTSKTNRLLNCMKKASGWYRKLNPYIVELQQFKLVTWLSQHFSELSTRLRMCSWKRTKQSTGTEWG